MKDRIRQIMESQHMTQQVFADYIGTTPATLSGIFNDRTRPTINIVENIRKKFPDISLDWLMFGQGDMYKQPAASTQPDLFADEATPTVAQPATSTTPQPSTLPFQNSPRQSAPVSHAATTDSLDGVKTTLKETIREELKILNKQRRRVSEIRVFYDDGSYESFLPASHG